MLESIFAICIIMEEINLVQEINKIRHCISLEVILLISCKLYEI